MLEQEVIQGDNPAFTHDQSGFGGFGGGLPGDPNIAPPEFDQTAPIRSFIDIENDELIKIRSALVTERNILQVKFDSPRQAIDKAIKCAKNKSSCVCAWCKK